MIAPAHEFHDELGECGLHIDFPSGPTISELSEPAIPACQVASGEKTHRLLIRIKARVLSEPSLLLQKLSMVSLRREQRVAVFPWLVPKASSLYCAPRTVPTRKNPSMFQNG